MNTHWLAAPIWTPLLQTLAGTLWQGAFSAGILLVGLRTVPVRYPSLRYGLCAGALGLILLMAASTWISLGGASAPARAVPWSTSPALWKRGAIEQSSPESQERSTEPEAWARWATVFWLLGSAAGLARMARGLAGATRLRQRCRGVADPSVLVMADGLRGRLCLSRHVPILVSDDLEVPSAMGIFWPAILLPATLCAGVSADVLRAVLAHELAHIRRHDYLVNLAQMLAEALLFFNPFVWWISRQMRVEREVCCDHLASKECRSLSSYIEALLSVVARCHAPAGDIQPPPLLKVVGQAGRNGLLERVRRLLLSDGPPDVGPFPLRYCLVAVPVAAALFYTGFTSLHQVKQTTGTNPPVADQTQPADSLAGLHSNRDLITDATRFFANVPVGELHMQVLLEKYVDGREILTVVTQRFRESPPTPASAVHVRLFRGDGSEWRPRSLLDDADALLCLDRGWSKRVSENALYDLANVDLATIDSVQLEVRGQASERVKIQEYDYHPGQRRNLPRFDEKTYSYRQFPLHLYSVHWQPAGQRDRRDEEGTRNTKPADAIDRDSPPPTGGEFRAAEHS